MIPSKITSRRSATMTFRWHHNGVYITTGARAQMVNLPDEGRTGTGSAGCAHGFSWWFDSYPGGTSPPGWWFHTFLLIINTWLVGQYFFIGVVQLLISYAYHWLKSSYQPFTTMKTPPDPMAGGHHDWMEAHLLNEEKNQFATTPGSFGWPSEILWWRLNTFMVDHLVHWPNILD